MERKPGSFVLRDWKDHLEFKIKFSKRWKVVKKEGLVSELTKSNRCMFCKNNFGTNECNQKMVNSYQCLRHLKNLETQQNKILIKKNEKKESDQTIKRSRKELAKSKSHSKDDEQTNQTIKDEDEKQFHQKENYEQPTHKEVKTDEHPQSIGKPCINSDRELRPRKGSSKSQRTMSLQISHVPIPEFTADQSSLSLNESHYNLSNDFLGVRSDESSENLQSELSILSSLPDDFFNRINTSDYLDISIFDEFEEFYRMSSIEENSSIEHQE